MRFEDTPGLFGSGLGINTRGDFKCGICGKKYNIGADKEEDYENREGLTVEGFAGIDIGECCFEKVEDSVIKFMPLIIPWYKRILVARRKNLEDAEGVLKEVKG